MLIGHEELIENFKRLTKSDGLSHGYIFFGEPQVGKFTFGKCLANFLETGEFELPTSYLKEILEIVPADGTIGIETIRGLQRFLYEKPVNSKKRFVLIDDAHDLTLQAQNAILKIAEEPPQSSLIVLIVSNPEALLPTLQSRFVKIYFGRINSQLIQGFLTKNFHLDKTEAERIVSYSFGRPGRAVEILQNEEFKRIRGEVVRFIKYKSGRGAYLRSLEEVKDINLFLRELMAELSLDPKKNYLGLKNISDCIVKMSNWNTNKRLQLEASLWNI